MTTVHQMDKDLEYVLHLLDTHMLIDDAGKTERTLSYKIQAYEKARQNLDKAVTEFQGFSSDLLIAKLYFETVSRGVVLESQLNRPAYFANVNLPKVAIEESLTKAYEVSLEFYEMFTNAVAGVPLQMTQLSWNIQREFMKLANLENKYPILEKVVDFTRTYLFAKKGSISGPQPEQIFPEART